MAFEPFPVFVFRSSQKNLCMAAGLAALPSKLMPVLFSLRENSEEWLQQKHKSTEKIQLQFGASVANNIVVKPLHKRYKVFLRT